MFLHEFDLVILFQLSCVERNKASDEKGKMALVQLVDRVEFIPSAHHHRHVEPLPAFVCTVRLEHGQRDLYFMLHGVIGCLHCLLLY
jgi:hypothetical protein